MSIGLLTLPNELLLQITEHLRIKTLYRFLQVNQHLKNLLTPLLHNHASQYFNGAYALHWAARTEQEELVRTILDKGVHANSGDEYKCYLKQRMERNTALQLSVENGPRPYHQTTNQ